VPVNDCVITAPPVNFGSAPLVSGFPAISQSISLLCSKNLSYTVGMGSGNAPQGGRRNMSSGSNRLAYDIFKADNTVWGDGTTARASGPAASDGVSVQTLPYTAGSTRTRQRLLPPSIPTAWSWT
jgi:spore coat protein U-like protein